MLELEPRTYGLAGRRSFPGPTQPQAVTESAPPNDTRFDTKGRDLKLICDAWLTLPDAVKAGILAMVRASAGTSVS